MAADSAATWRDRNGVITHIETGIPKLFEIPSINAGISCWGIAQVGDIEIERWVPSFIEENENEYNNIHDFAILLQNKVRKFSIPITSAEDSLEYKYGNRGFHLAGHVSYLRQNTPTFYHVHNGLSDTNQSIDPRIINANHDLPPMLVRRIFDEIENKNELDYPHIRNGDFRRYATMYNTLYDLITRMTLNGEKIIFPDFNQTNGKLDLSIEYAKFWYKLTIDVYKMSDLQNVISGPIKVMTIDNEGNVAHYDEG